MTPEERAEKYIRDKAGPALYVEYAKHCQTIEAEPVHYLAFLRIMLQTIGGLKQ